ncbi:MAG: histidine phosphatase family protein [Gemmatimonadetes bacterium]|nr:histidine phosphatase family protein [Gemmatimonadota bacterium]
MPRSSFPRRHVSSGRARLALGALRLLLVGALALPLATTPLAAQPSLVVLVRHGEKEAQPADDPSLSAAGVARAQALADALAHVTPSTIVVSTRKRTVETAAVVAKQRGITPTVVSLDGGGAAHIRAVADAVMKASGVVLVVGHSNTVPAIIGALGGPKLPDICDASYATLFVLTPARAGQPVQLVRSQYGTPDAAGAATCAGMTPR